MPLKLRMPKLPKLKTKTVGILVIVAVVVIVLATQMSTEGFQNNAPTKAPLQTACFNAVCYADRYPDLKNAFGAGTDKKTSELLWSHWYWQGYTEGRNPCCQASTPPPPKPPTYSVKPVTNSVNEGSSITFKVETSNVANGTTLYWSITNPEDFNLGSNTISGGVIITDNTGSFTVTPTADAKTEGAETFTASLRTGSTNGPVVATSSPVTINDTSLTPPPSQQNCPPPGNPIWVPPFQSCPPCYNNMGIDWSRFQQRCQVPAPPPPPTNTTGCPPRGSQVWIFPSWGQQSCPPCFTNMGSDWSRGGQRCQVL